MLLIDKIDHFIFAISIFKSLHKKLFPFMITEGVLT